MVMTVRFHPESPHLVLTAGSNAGVFSWDTRAPAKYVRSAQRGKSLPILRRG